MHDTIFVVLDVVGWCARYVDIVRTLLLFLQLSLVVLFAVFVLLLLLVSRAVVMVYCCC